MSNRKSAADSLIATLIVTLQFALVGAGFFAGWKVRGATLQTKEPSAERPDEEEARRAQEREEAFQKMMGYSVETAYGLNKGKEVPS